jgi:Uma2 family endonuclease
VSVLVQDRDIARSLKAQRRASDAGQFDEVWDGVYVKSPSANNLHQWIVVQLILTFQHVLNMDGGDRMYPGLNVSDREEDWTHNYRVPDLAIFLHRNTARDLETHWCGGPDLVVEVVSPDDREREKMPFYAGIGVREVLIIDRAPWAVEVYQLDGTELKVAGKATPDQPESISRV